MSIDIKTVSAQGLDGIMRDRRPKGFYMAMAEPRLLFWRACEVRDGRVARYSGTFPEVIDWLFRRAGVLPRGTRVKNRVVGELNPWRIRLTMPGKTAVDAAPAERAEEVLPEAVGTYERKSEIFHGGWGTGTIKVRR